MYRVFKDSLFDAQWMRAVGHGSSGGAEISECFAAACQIRAADAESWFEAWNGLAEGVLAQAEASQAAGRTISAGLTTDYTLEGCVDRIRCPTP